MAKTPSYLKGLAETRARAAGDVLTYEKMHADVTKRLGDARMELEACDRLIKKFDKRLDPNRIEPIRGTTGRYKRHGGLRDCLLDYLKDQYPSEVSTSELSLFAQAEFDLAFAGWKAYHAWMNNSLGRQIRRLCDEGLIERMHDALAPPSGEAGRWRWKGAASSPTLEGLRQQAAVSGVSVQLADGDHE